MLVPKCLTSLCLAVLVAASSSHASQARDSSATRLDSTKGAGPTYPWRGRVLYGGGPSVGAPPSDYTGAKPPSKWCLQATGRAPGDLGVGDQSWDAVSRSWLRQVLSDTTAFGAGWRKVLGGAPRIGPRDSIMQVSDEEVCRDIAAVINRGLLGWDVGPPPVVVLRLRDYLVAYPSNAPMGEFGLAVGMTLAHEIRGVATW